MNANAPTATDTVDVEISTVRLAAVMLSTLALCATVVGGYIAVLSN